MILVAQDLEGLQTGTGTVFSASLFLKGYKYIASVKGINYDSSNTHVPFHSKEMLIQFETTVILSCSLHQNKTLVPI